MANVKEEIQTVRLPLLGDMTLRGTSASKDQRFVNGYFDVFKNPVTGKEHYYFIKRAGLSQNIRPPAGNAIGRGVYYWKGNVYSVFGNKIYSGLTDLGASMTTATGRVSFQETRPGATTEYLCVNDGVKLYLIDISGVVTVVTMNFPNPNTTDLVYFDGYLFTLDTDGNLWNSAVDDPTTWSNSTYITAMMYNSTGVGLAHQNNYIVVLGNSHFQMFFDNANASGSPMNNSDILVQQIGCASNNSIISASVTAMWVGNMVGLGGYSVYRMDGITKASRCSTDGIDRILNAEGTDIVTCAANQIKVSGHNFYVLSLTRSNRTFVYDLDNSLWFEWEAAAGGAKWPIISSVQAQFVPVVQHATNGWIYILDNATTQDDSVNFTVLARTGRIDFEDNQRKFVQKVELVGDVQATTTNVSLQYSDDDYVTLSTARILDQSLAHPYTSALGNFRRRGWQLSYTGSNPIRWEALEMTIRKAT